jgi:hypothetical protein
MKRREVNRFRNANTVRCNRTLQYHTTFCRFWIKTVTQHNWLVTSRSFRTSGSNPSHFHVYCVEQSGAWARFTLCTSVFASPLIATLMFHTELTTEVANRSIRGSAPQHNKQESVLTACYARQMYFFNHQNTSFSAGPIT